MSHDRRAASVNLLDELSIDGLLITNGTNRRYLTGYTGEDHAADELCGVVLITGDGTTLLVPSTDYPWAKSEAYEGVEVVAWSPPVGADIAKRFADAGAKMIGFEDATTTVAFYNQILEHADGRLELKPIGNAVDKLRLVKSDEEINLLRKAADLTDQAFMAAEKRASAGMTEREFADIIREELRNVGSDGESFSTIVASGPNAAKPHHAPGDRVMNEGEPIIIDMGAVYKGYAGDMTRTIWFGQPTEQLVTMYNAVMDAFDAAEAKAGPGISGVEFDAAARDVLAQKDLAQYFVHSLGHGLGLRVHEAPSLSMRSKDDVEAGQIVTIEPGVYLDDWGGIRIEDTLLITADGSENMNRAPKRSTNDYKG